MDFNPRRFVSTSPLHFLGAQAHKLQVKDEGVETVLEITVAVVFLSKQFCTMGASPWFCNRTNARAEFVLLV